MHPEDSGHHTYHGHMAAGKCIPLRTCWRLAGNPLGLNHPVPPDGLSVQEGKMGRHHYLKEIGNLGIRILPIDKLSVFFLGIE